MTISSDELVRRNAAFAATGAFAGLPFPTSDTLQVLGCVDSRVDPGDVLGLELGEGVVMRNIGGRITPAALRSWTLLGRLGQGQPPRSGHLVLLHQRRHCTRAPLAAGTAQSPGTTGTLLHSTLGYRGPATAWQRARKCRKLPR